MRLPSPPTRQQREEEIQEVGGEQWQHGDTQAGGGLTAHQGRSDRPGPSQPHHRQHSSPLRKLINLLAGICKSQRDIEVEQQRQWRAGKKERDSLKIVHNAVGGQPPRSPISPSPPEVEIESIDDRIQGYLNSDAYNQYGSMFPSDIGASSSAPPPVQPAMGFDTMFEGEPSYQTTDPPPEQWVPPPPTEDWVARASAELFRPPPSYGTDDYSLASPSEITVSDSIYLTSPMF